MNKQTIIIRNSSMNLDSIKNSILPINVLIYGDLLEEYVKIFSEFNNINTIKITDSNKKIDDNVFKKLSLINSLKKLIISDILVDNLDFIVYFQQIEILHINNMNIKKLPNNINLLKNLRVLWIYSTGLNTLPESIGSIIKLENLSLEMNKIEFLPDTICNLSSLKELTLFSNNIKNLPSNIGSLYSLTSLDIKWNSSLKILPSTITNLKNLISFGITINQFNVDILNNINLINIEIIEIDGRVNEVIERIMLFEKLKEIYIYESNLSEIPENILKLEDLEILFIDSCDIIHIPNKISNMKKLKEFSINSKNMLSKINLKTTNDRLN